MRSIEKEDSLYIQHRYHVDSLDFRALWSIRRRIFFNGVAAINQRLIRARFLIESLTDIFQVSTDINYCWWCTALNGVE